MVTPTTLQTTATGQRAHGTGAGKAYTFNRESNEGRRLFRLLDAQYTPASIEPIPVEEMPKFSSRNVRGILNCHTEQADIIIPSNLSRIQRPQIRLSGTVTSVWGDITPDTTTLEFATGQELPMSVVYPIDDNAMQTMIQAGLYSNPRFPDVFSKIIRDEMFDIEADITLHQLDVSGEFDGREVIGEPMSVLFVDPVDVSVSDDDLDYEHPENNPQTSINDLVARTSGIMIELESGGRTKEVLAEKDAELGILEEDNEIILPFDIEDVVTQTREEERIAKAQEQEQLRREGYATRSDLLDREIDVTDKFDDAIMFDESTEDDRIRRLKDLADTTIPQVVKPNDKPKVRRPQHTQPFGESEPESDTVPVSSATLDELRTGKTRYYKPSESSADTGNTPDHDAPEL